MRACFLSAATFALIASPALAQTQTVKGTEGSSIKIETLEEFDGAWAMTFLPNGQALVTEKEGAVWLLDKDGSKSGKIGNAPKVTARGQGGMGDIVIHPDFAKNNTVFISYVERDSKNSRLSGAVVDRATLVLSGRGGQLTNRTRIWEQSPKVTGNGHYGHRLAIAPPNSDTPGDLFISSGDRQKFTPSQNMSMNLGKILRIHPDGTVPEDNPFYAEGGVTAQIWSIGHRNPLGLAFDAQGQLWEHEMGPAHGDELNKIVRSENYGYPVVSNGEHYSGKKIPDHDEFPIYEKPKAYWIPAISPAGFMIYQDDLFGDWNGDGFIGGLSSQALVRVTFDNEGGAEEAERFEWGARIREVEQGPDGAIYVLEDNDGRLLKVTPG